MHLMIVLQKRWNTSYMFPRVYKLTKSLSTSAQGILSTSIIFTIYISIKVLTRQHEVTHLYKYIK